MNNNHIGSVTKYFSLPKHSQKDDLGGSESYLRAKNENKEKLTASGRVENTTSAELASLSKEKK